jgi:hypothetical protein
LTILERGWGDKLMEMGIDGIGDRRGGGRRLGILWMERIGDVMGGEIDGKEKEGLRSVEWRLWLDQDLTGLDVIGLGLGLHGVQEAPLSFVTFGLSVVCRFFSGQRKKKKQQKSHRYVCTHGWVVVPPRGGTGR